MTASSTPSRLSSANALRKLLLLVVANPSAYSRAPISGHLKSQSALAGFSSDELRIRGGSLNTLKRSCIGIEGGFEALDRLRKGALDSLRAEDAKQLATPKTTKAALAERVSRLSSDLAAATEDLLLLSRMLERALRQGRQYANDSGSSLIAERCNKDQSEIRDMMTLRQTSLGKFKVIKDDHAA